MEQVVYFGKWGLLRNVFLNIYSEFSVMHVKSFPFFKQRSNGMFADFSSVSWNNDKMC